MFKIDLRRTVVKHFMVWVDLTDFSTEPWGAHEGNGEAIMGEVGTLELSSVSDLALVRDRAYVGGAWIEADSGATMPVTNPATCEVLGVVPRMGAPETQRAVDAAKKAQPAWAAHTAKERAAVVRRWSDL